MKKLSKYILVHDPAVSGIASAPIKKFAPSKTAILKRALTMTSMQATRSGLGAPSADISWHCKKVIPGRALTMASKLTAMAIGLWDLGAWVGGLTRLIDEMNRTQKTFTFYEVKATVPAGLVSRPQRVIPWLAGSLHRKLKTSEKRDIKNNLIANDYFKLAEKIRRDLPIKIDYIVGITPSMVAEDDGKDVFWNHFSSFNSRTILVSTYQLREFAKKTGRPFEVFLAGIIIAQVLVAKFYPKVGFHDNSGCLFDYNEDRVSIMEKVSDPKIETDCMNAIGKTYHPAILSLMGFLRNYRKN